MKEIRIAKRLQVALIILLAGLIAGCSQKMHSHNSSENIYASTYVANVMKKAYNWQRMHPLKVNLRNDADWARAAFYIGAMRAYRLTGDTAFLNGALKYAESVNWEPALRFYHADDVARGQVFLDLYEVKKDPHRIVGIQGRMDSLMADPKTGRELWWWCDALFMAPPVLARLYDITGKSKYKDYLNRMWWDATEFLYDPEEHLYFRDERFFNTRTSNGNKLFWSRGNGWVMAGLAQVIERLPKSDPYYSRYVNLFRQMAAKIASLQQPDGLWRANLLDPEETPTKETSGSGFYTFAIAWGINHEVLDEATYLPVLKKGWEALNNAVESSGKLTWVQPIGAKPEAVKQSDNQEYGTGAFLMTGTEIIQLSKKDKFK